jgi:hypothetical protein
MNRSEEIDQNISKIFESIGKDLDKFRGIELPFNSGKSKLCMTTDNNLLYYDKGDNKIGLWSMSNNKSIIVKDSPEKTSKVYSSIENKFYLIGN